jgi:hypothetical protein
MHDGIKTPNYTLKNFSHTNAENFRTIFQKPLGTKTDGSHDLMNPEVGPCCKELLSPLENLTVFRTLSIWALSSWSFACGHTELLTCATVHNN